MKAKEFLKRHRKWWIAVVVIAVIAAAAVLIAGRVKRPRGNSQAMPAQETAQVERRSLMETISATGTVVSAENKDVTVSLSGMKVREVNVKVGDRVAAGDVICRFDTTDLEEDLADAKTTLNASSEKSAVDVASAQRGLSEAQTAEEIEVSRANADTDEAYQDYLRAKTDEEEAEDDYNEAQQTTASKNAEWQAAKKRMEDAEKNMEKAANEVKKLSGANGKAAEEASKFATTVEKLAGTIPADKKVLDVKSFLYIENEELNQYEVSDFLAEGADDAVAAKVGDYLTELKNLQISYLAAKAEQDAYDAANANYQKAQSNYQEAQQVASSWETKYNTAKNSESSYENALDQAVNTSDSKYSAYEQQARNRDDAVRNSESTVSSKEDALTNSRLNASTTALSDKQQIRSLEEQIEDCTVKAPIGGIITSLNVEEGSTFSSTNGAAVAVIEDVSAYEVEAEIDEYDISKIEEGQSVVIKTNGTGDAQLDGRVKEIAPRASAADGSSSSVTYKVTVSIDTPNEALRMDMTAKLSIVIESREDVLTVPYDAVQEADDGTYYVQLAGEDSGTGGQGADGAATQTGQDIGEEKEQAGQNAGETTGQPPTGTGRGPGGQGMFPGSGSLPDGAAAGVTTAGRRITVEKGIESDYYIEVVSDELTEGMEVIVPASEESGTDARGMIGMQGPMGGF